MEKIGYGAVRDKDIRDCLYGAFLVYIYKNNRKRGTKMENAVLTVDWNLLGNISYRSELGKSLKNTLRKFNKDELFDELDTMISYFTEYATEEAIPHENRIKSLQSCELKYEKYFPAGPVEKTFNDILGLRIVIDDYEVFDQLELPDHVKVADMRNGKANDDGYRGIHLYYQKDHYHYPIEVQFVTAHDRQFNEWLHIYVYKYIADENVGIHLRQLYDTGKITKESQFVEELRKCVT